MIPETKHRLYATIQAVFLLCPCDGMEYILASDTRFWEFESPHGHFAGLMERNTWQPQKLFFKGSNPLSCICSCSPMEEAADLNPAQYEFDSHQEHQGYDTKGDVFHANY